MKKNHAVVLGLFFLSTSYQLLSQASPYNGLDSSLANLYRLANAKTFSISPENLTGEKGKGGMAVQGNASQAARDLGQGWKVNPYVIVEPGKTFTMAEINASGAIQHIWLTPTGNWRLSILRMYWLKKLPTVFLATQVTSRFVNSSYMALFHRTTTTGQAY